jgi:hypothetical protein
MRPIYTVLDDAGGPPMNLLSADAPTVKAVRERMKLETGTRVKVVYFPTLEIDERFFSDDSPPVNWRTITDFVSAWTRKTVEPNLRRGVSVLQLGGYGGIVVGYARDDEDVRHAKQGFRPITPDFTFIVMNWQDFIDPEDPETEADFQHAKSLYWSFRETFLGSTGRFVTHRAGWPTEFEASLAHRELRPRRWDMRRVLNEDQHGA